MKAEEKALTSAEIEEIVGNWKKDSTGCLRLRDYGKMKRVIEQLSLIGKDSLTVVSYLGEPNAKYGESSKRHYLYFIECGKGKVSYSNAYCHFLQDTLYSFQGAVF
jgi:hypothetical protein